MKKGSCKDILNSKTTNESLACLGKINAHPQQKLLRKKNSPTVILATNPLVLEPILLPEMGMPVSSSIVPLPIDDLPVSSEQRGKKTKKIPLSIEDISVSLTQRGNKIQKIPVYSPNISISAEEVPVSLSKRGKKREELPVSSSNVPVPEEKTPKSTIVSKNTPHIMPFMTDNAVAKGNKFHHLLFDF